MVVTNSTLLKKAKINAIMKTAPPPQIPPPSSLNQSKDANVSNPWILVSLNVLKRSEN